MTVVVLVAGSLAGSVLYRRRSARRLERVELYARRRLDGLAPRRLAEDARADPRAGPRRPVALVSRMQDGGDSAPARSARPRCSRATSCSARAGAARTTSTSTASRRGPTCCARSASAIAAAVREYEPDAVRLAAPELGAVPLAAAASLETGPPVRDRARSGEGVRHRQPDRGRRSSPASASASSRTSSPPAARRSRRSRRSARPGSRSRPSVCVVDREEGGADALARSAVRLRPLLLASEVRMRLADSAWLSDIRPGC